MKKVWFLSLVVLVFGISVGYSLSFVTEVTRLQGEITNVRAELTKTKDELDELKAIQPKITMVDIGWIQTTICFGSRSVGATFNLVNTGKADGIAVVRLTSGERTLAENTYHVRAGDRITRTLQVTASCDPLPRVNLVIVDVKSA